MKDLRKNGKGLCYLLMHCARHEITLMIYMNDSFLNNSNNQIVLLMYVIRTEKCIKLEVIYMNSWKHNIRTIHHKHLICYELSFKTNNRYLQNCKRKIFNSNVGKTARLMDQYFKQIVGLFCRHPDDKKYRQNHDYWSYIFT